VLGVLATAGAGPAAADSVSGNDARDVFVVTAGSGSGTTDVVDGGCHGCATVIAVPVCLMGISFESPQPGSGCLTVGSRDCAVDEQFVREWTAGPDGWIQGGVSCRNLSGAPTIEQIAAEVRARVAHHVPAPGISLQPQRAPIVRLPVLLDSGQPDGDVEWQDVVAGVPVTTRVAAQWTWRFSDGEVLHTDQAGSRWPDTTVSHVFETGGTQQIELSTTWSGTFAIAGLGDQQIAGVVTQEAATNLRVHTAAAVLEPSHQSPVGR
jgi:hypothetical protein